MQKMLSNWCDYLKPFFIMFIFIETHFLPVINGFLPLNGEKDTECKTNFDNNSLVENKSMLSRHLYEPFPELLERRSSYLPPKEKSTKPH